MEKLNSIKLNSATIEVEYEGLLDGQTVTRTATFSPDPAWTAVLLRYLEFHAERGVHGEGAASISLQGACGEFPAVERHRWEPSAAFIG